MAVPRVAPAVAREPAQLSEESAPVPTPREFRCDRCGKTFQGLPGGSGLLVWTRGDEIRFEEPPLCDRCATRITVGALAKWSLEEDEEE